jgi:hypothetical protein
MLSSKGLPVKLSLMWFKWRDARISFILDDRHVRNVVADTEPTLDVKPAGNGAAD